MSDNPTSGQIPTHRSESSPAPQIAGCGIRCSPFIRAFTQPLTPLTVVGFGKFTTRDRPARAGRNPQTGEAVVASRACSSRPRRPFATRPTHSRGTGPVESPALAAPMASRTHCRAPRREHSFAIHARRRGGSEVPVLPQRLHPDGRRTGPRGHQPPAIPLTPLAVRPRSAPKHLVSRTFGAGTIIDGRSRSPSPPSGRTSGSANP